MNSKTKHYSSFQTKLLDAHLGQSYHVYELIWEPKLLTLLLDGVVYGTISLDAKELIESRTFDKEVIIKFLDQFTGLCCIIRLIFVKSAIPVLSLDWRGSCWNHCI